MGWWSFVASSRVEKKAAPAKGARKAADAVPADENAAAQTTIDAGLLTRLCAGGHENATTVAPDGSQDPLDLPFPVAVSLVAVLLCLSGLFSGLTLGLMSLDRLNLQVIEKGGDAKERKWAATIRPLRDQGNLLLCTLLLGNTLVNSLISILLDSVTQGMVAVLVATFVILIFGEIIPQAICVRFGLACPICTYRKDKH